MIGLLIFWVLVNLVAAPIVIGHDLEALTSKEWYVFLFSIFVIFWAWPLILLFRLGRSLAEDKREARKRGY